MFVRSFAVLIFMGMAVPAQAQEFVVESDGGDYRLQVGTVFQADEHSAFGDAAPVVDTFLVRKARIVVSTRLARYFDVKIVPDFASGAVQLPDAYFDTRFAQHFRVRIGKDKTPVGYELLMADANGWFPERALTSSLVPNRDLGVQAQGELAGGRVAYGAGVFNGVADGGSSSAGIDTNGGKDVAGRVVVQPVRGVGVHVGASTGRETNGLPSFKTSIGQTYFSYASGTVADGWRHRVSPAAFYFRGRFGAFAEYARSAQEVARGGVRTPVSNSSWEVSGSYALTGEDVSDRNIRPRSPFDAANRRWGALQVLARYSSLTVDRSAFTAGVAATGASRTAAEYTAALNWYPTNFVKWYAAYEWTCFDRTAPAPRPAGSSIIVRAQVAFQGI